MAQKKFSILRFSIMVAVQFGLLLLALRACLPGVWHTQLAAGWLAILLTFLAIHLLNSFFEWFFHRYSLHAMILSWFKGLAASHRHHHSLTKIMLDPIPAGEDRFVLNRYSIVAEEQFESSAFPAWALLAFWVLFTPFLVVLQLLMPRLPIIIAGYAAYTWSMVCYEILHAIEHRPYEWWKHATEHPRFGPMWRKLYGFHHMHHANIRCNEAIGGFFGLPIADWVFGTYHQPKELLLDGRVATAKQFAIPQPGRITRWLDRWAMRRETKILRR